MIPKIQTRGASFTGLATYLTHDAKAETAERVAWTHTLNLAHDHVPSAVDEMLWTARAAELLKQEAGMRAGGRVTENPVKHVSLNWAIEDRPTRDHMIETAEDFLRHMKWHEHQAILVAHQDKAHAHVHVMLNAVHPETGLKIDEGFEQRRAQAWALDYEREQGRIYCAQRLKDPSEREDAPTRPAWLAFQDKQQAFERDENSLRAQEPILLRESEIPENGPAAEWKKLKDIQRREREGFFAEGKLAFAEVRCAVYKDVRMDYRDQWAEIYAAQKEGIDPEFYAFKKQELIEVQKAVLEARRDAACQELRESRNDHYRDLLDDQRDIRHSLRARQDAGFDNAVFLELIADRDPHKDMMAIFAEAAAPVTVRQDQGRQDDSTPFRGSPGEDSAGMRSAGDAGADIATGLGFSLISFFESLADGFVGAKPDLSRRQPEPKASPDPDPFEAVIDQARQRQRNEQEEAERDWRRKQRSYGE